MRRLIIGCAGAVLVVLVALNALSTVSKVQRPTNLQPRAVGASSQLAKLLMAAASPPPPRVLPPPLIRRDVLPLPVPRAVAAPLTMRAAASGCSGTAHVELWGSLVQPGDSNLQATAEACCQSCREYEPTSDVLNGAQCNTWVWHPQTQHCWLKFESPSQLEQAARALSGPGRSSVPWTSGVWTEHKPCLDCIVPTSFTGCISKDRCNTSRACGSPAIDGYSHVRPACFQASPTFLTYQRLLVEKTVLVAAHELNSDYDGLGVRWGIGHKKQAWQECEQACRDHIPRAGGGPYASLPCNVWTWCSQPKCFEPDPHSHSFGDCWLKFSELPEAPEVNMRHPMRTAFLKRHRTQMVAGVPWVSGALLPPGVPMTNGTWGPRAYW